MTPDPALAAAEEIIEEDAAKWNHIGSPLSVVEVERIIRRHLAEALEDVERMDWLIPHLGELLVHREDDGHRDGALSYRFVNHIGGHATLRAAIDAAREGGEK